MEDYEEVEEEEQEEEEQDPDDAAATVTTSTSSSTRTSATSSSTSSNANNRSLPAAVIAAAGGIATAPSLLWMVRYNELLEFKQRFGHCLVPNNYRANIQLGRWVKRQRQLNKQTEKFELEHHERHGQQQQVDRNKNKTPKNGGSATGTSTSSTSPSSSSPSSKKDNGKSCCPTKMLTKERKKLLQDIGFIWDSHEAIWDERYTQLEQFKSLHGNCKIPTRYPACPELAVWAKRQRRQFQVLLQEARKQHQLEQQRSSNSSGNGGGTTAIPKSIFSAFIKSKSNGRSSANHAQPKCLSALTMERLMKLADIGFVFDNSDCQKTALHMIMDNIVQMKKMSSK